MATDTKHTETTHVVDEAHASKKAAAYRTIFLNFIALAVLTGIEYYIGLVNSSLVPLFIIALFKTLLIVYFFMHIYRLWREEAH